MSNITKLIPVYTKTGADPITRVHLLVDSIEIVDRCQDIYLIQTKEHFFAFGGTIEEGGILRSANNKEPGARSLNLFIGGPKFLNKQRRNTGPHMINNLSGKPVYDYRSINFRVMESIIDNTGIVDENTLSEDGGKLSDLVDIEREVIEVGAQTNLKKRRILIQRRGTEEAERQSTADLVSKVIRRLQDEGRISYELHDHSDGRHRIELKFII